MHGMTAITLAILAGRMAALTADFILMNGVGDLIAFVFMAGLTFRAVLDVIF